MEYQKVITLLDNTTNQRQPQSQTKIIEKKVYIKKLHYIHG